MCVDQTKLNDKVEPFPFRVAIGPLDLRNIPVFALAHERTRPAFEQMVSTSYKAAEAAIGRDAASALCKGRYGAFQVVVTRERVATQTAAYRRSIAFDDGAAARKFELDHINGKHWAQTRGRF